MCSSKGKVRPRRQREASSPKPEPPTTQKRNKQRALWVVFLLLVGVAVFLFMRNFRVDHEQVVRESRQQIEQAVTDPSNAQSLGKLESNTDALREAVVAEWPDRETARLFLCVALCSRGSRMGRLSVAESRELQEMVEQLEYQRCRSSDLLNAGRLLVLLRARPIAATIMAELMQRDDESRAESLRFAIEMLRGNPRQEDALLEYCYELAKVAPGDVRPWLLIADIYEQRGLRLQLKDVYQEVIRRSPAHAPEYRMRLVLRLVEIGEVAEARSEFDQLARESPALMREFPMVEPQLLHLEGKVQLAEESARRVLATGRANLAASLVLSRILLSREQPVEALRLLSPLANEHGDNLDLLYLLGQAHNAVGNEALGKQYLFIHQELDRIRREPVDGATSRRLGDAYEAVGDAQRSSRWRQNATRFQGDDEVDDQ